MAFNRDFEPTVPCDLTKTGSDICESTFSTLTGSGQVKNGGRKMTAVNVKQTLNSSNTLKQMKHIKFRRSHSKQEFTPELFEDKEEPDADMLAFPSVAETVRQTILGLEEAREKVQEFGIKSKTLGGCIPDESWEEPWQGEIPSKHRRK